MNRISMFILIMGIILSLVGLKSQNYYLIAIGLFLLFLVILFGFKTPKEKDKK